MGMDWPWQYSFPPFFTIQVSGLGHLFPPKQINCWQRLPLTAPQCNQSKTAGGLETSGSQLLSGGICCKFTRDENKDFQVHTISVLDLADAGDLPLFHNASISRRLPAEAILTVLEDLAQQWVDINLRDLSIFLTHSGNLEWTDKSKRRGHIFWKSPAQLGQEIYKWGRHLIYLEVHLIHIRWVSDSGQKGAVVTLVELEEEGESNSWRGVSQEVVMQDHGVYLMCITFRWL